MRVTPETRRKLYIKFKVIFPDKISSERQVYLKKLLKPVNNSGEDTDKIDIINSISKSWINAANLMNLSLINQL